MKSNATVTIDCPFKFGLKVPTLMLPEQDIVSNNQILEWCLGTSQQHFSVNFRRHGSMKALLPRLQSQKNPDRKVSFQNIDDKKNHHIHSSCQKETKPFFQVLFPPTRQFSQRVLLTLLIRWKYKSFIIIGVPLSTMTQSAQWYKYSDNYWSACTTYYTVAWVHLSSTAVNEECVLTDLPEVTTWNWI